MNNMFWTIIGILILLIGLGIIGWIIVRKLPQLRMVDPNSLKEVQAKRLKHDILLQRIERLGQKYTVAARENLVFKPSKKAQEGFRRFAGKLTAIERRYQEKKRKGGLAEGNQEMLVDLLEQGRDFVKKEIWDRAEKAFIEVISYDAKNIEAYENLARLYLRKKEYELAKETFQFLKKISSQDASVIAGIGELEMKLGHLQSAQAAFQEAVEINPKNPKYLDFLIHATIEIGDKEKAYEYLAQLKEVNPENKKITALEQQINEMNKETK